jgi:hypothetical protein
MASPQSLEEIIRKECLPLRDCMLTVTDSTGEAAFLYFKEGELIEANYSALWGKEALAQIITWKLADSTIAPLPLGIKRSLWDQIEFLLNPGLAATASAKFQRTARRAREPVRPFQKHRRAAQDSSDRKGQERTDLRGARDCGRGGDDRMARRFCRPRARRRRHAGLRQLRALDGRHGAVSGGGPGPR